MALNTIFGKLTARAIGSGGRPPVAVELAAEGVLAATPAGHGRPPACAFAPLPTGALEPSLAETNMANPAAVTSAIRTALAPLATHGHAVTLLVPDPVVRVFVLDFDALPAKAAEAILVLRFRLRKMVPFEVEQAGMSYQILSQNRDECRVLVAVVPAERQAEYEGAVRAAGFEPGALLPAGLAALAALNSPEAQLIARLSGTTLTTAVVNGNDLLLYRSVELPADPDERLADLRRGIAVSAAYYEDRLGQRPRYLLFSGSGNLEAATAETFARLLDDPELTVAELYPRPETGAATPLGHLSLAGVAGALAGAA